MFSFLPSRKGLGNRALLRQLIDRQEETNLLLRELLVAVGVRSQVFRRQPPSEGRKAPYTDKDVFRVTRADQLRAEAEAQERLLAPWRTPVSGQDSSQTLQNGGTAPLDIDTGPNPAA